MNPGLKSRLPSLRRWCRRPRFFEGRGDRLRVVLVRRPLQCLLVERDGYCCDPHSLIRVCRPQFDAVRSIHPHKKHRRSPHVRDPRNEVSF